MSQTLRLVIPTTPQPEVRPNAAYGVKPWQQAKAREEKRRLRAMAKHHASNVLFLAEKVGAFEPFPDTASVHVAISWEKVRTPRYANGRYRPRVDPDALALMCKGLIDGLTDAGVWKDDRNLSLTYEQGKAEALTDEEGERRFYQGTNEFTGWTIITIQEPPTP